MTKSIVFANYDNQSSSTAISTLRKIKGVIETYATNGVYDVVLKVEANGESEIRGSIKNVANVAGVLGIVSNVTMVVNYF